MELLGRPLRPDAVRFVSELPKTRNAKILRRGIRGAYLGHADPGDLSALENPPAEAEIPELASSLPEGRTSATVRPSRTLHQYPPEPPMLRGPASSRRCSTTCACSGPKTSIPPRSAARAPSDSIPAPAGSTAPAFTAAGRARSCSRERSTAPSRW